MLCESSASPACCRAPRSRSSGKSGAANGEWRSYGGDLGHTRYSPLDQINAANFNKLEVAWRFKTDSLGPRPEFKLEGDAADGQRRRLLHRRHAPRRGRARRGHRRDCCGCTASTKARAARPRRASSPAAAWPTGPTAATSAILYVTPGYRLIALDAKTGAPVVSSFGNNGVVDLKQDDDQDIDLVTGEIGLHSTPVVAKNVVIVGAAHRSGGVPQEPTQREGLRARLRRAHRQAPVDLPHHSAAGRVRQRHLGERLVDLHRQHRRLGADLGRRRARASPICRSNCRPATTTAAIVPGNGLFGESLVAVDLQTGERKWHYPARASRHLGHGHPVRADPGRHHGQRPDRQGGGAADQAGVPLRLRPRSPAKPIWPIEENVRCAKGDVPGEWYSPTQPFPTKPPAYDRQGVSIDDLIDFTPELRAEAVEAWSRSTRSVRSSRRRS